MSTFYLATSIIYASGVPHIGNTYEAVLADAIARYRRLRGDDVFFLTGADEHGQKIQQNAARAGLSPQAYVDGVTGRLRAIWDLMNVSCDDFIRTTEERHKTAVQKIFQKLYETGDIYKGAYEGWYCVPDEAFFTETQAGESRLCPDCGRPLDRTSEEAYFFRLSAYQDRLLRHIEENPGFVAPESRKNEMLGFIRQGLQDFCVSRTTVPWGIPVGFDPAHTIYVWVDALSNYLTALGYDPYGPSGERFSKYWPCDVHIIGKDILRFHALYWPAMLMALGLPLPGRIFAHPWFLAEQDKMSKSRGNMLYAEELAKDYGVDAVRHYLLREMPYAQDGALTRELMEKRADADLANDLGNLASRTLAMAEKYFGGRIEGGNGAEIGTGLIDLYESILAKYTKSMDILHTSAAISEVFELVGAANLFIDQNEPWKLGRDLSKSGRLSAVLYALCDSLRRVSVLLWPVMPASMEALRGQLGLPAKPAWDEPPPPSFTVRKGENLFPRIQSREKPVLPASPPAGEAPRPPEAAPAPAEISIEEFAKTELCVARVLRCEPVEKSDRLLRLTLDAGEAEPRVVVSGIARWYGPGDLEGKNVCLVKNLRPAKLRGVLSRGMILAADQDDRAFVLFAPEGLPPGARVR